MNIFSSFLSNFWDGTWNVCAFGLISGEHLTSLLRHQWDRCSLRSSKWERNTSKDTGWASTVVDSPQVFLFFSFLNIIRGKILYINSLSFLVYMNFIYGGESFESLNAVLIFPLVNPRNPTQPKFDEFKDVMSRYCTFYHFVCMVGTCMPLITS